MTGAREGAYVFTIMELWRAGYGVVSIPPAEAEAIEAEGWDGQMAMDSHSLSADPYVVLTSLALFTSTLRLGTSVTNPYTRHPAVTASAMVSLQALSGGRAVLGIGRGDSSVAFLGRAPLPVQSFERSLRALQSYLVGEPVSFEEFGWDGQACNVSQLAPGYTPDAAQLRWLPGGLPKVPLDVAATGPRVIAAAARVAERVTLSVGATPRRVSWAVDIARAARSEAGLDPDDVSLGAQIVVVPHPQVATARELARNLVAPLARFSTIAGKTVGPATPAEEEVFAGLRAHYDMNRHGQAPAGVVTDEFVDRFAVIGPPERCVARMVELVKHGLRHFVVCPAVGGGSDAVAERLSYELLIAEVMPALRALA